MKSHILFIFSCVILLLVLSYPEEAKANRCHRTAYFPGRCEDVGRTSCLMDFKTLDPRFDQCSRCENHKINGKQERRCHCSFAAKSCF
ncbi:hypothetical protein HID58_036785 [Brassica napus]|uniref:Uncharacterized protein n=2 Tax=Brassica TaxID=3705 RepID=A0ABQ8C8S0_BRANA|nr:hypothetical protein HID58_036785 [Brassica napus]CAG7867382.1 unnamed protein product [Brassica rapa]VDC64313.1 unnamed protein product [Brassica rapa]